MGEKATEAMDEAAASLTLTLRRTITQGTVEAPTEMEGWMFKVRARYGHAVRMPTKRWMVLQGTTLIWYHDSSLQRKANSQALQGAVCVLPNTSSRDPAKAQAMHDFAELRQFPFTLTWPKGEDERDLVCAASTSTDRAQVWKAPDSD